MTNPLLKIIIPLSAAAVISRTFDEFGFFYYLLVPLFIYLIFFGYRFIFKDEKLKNIIILVLLFGLWAGLTSLWSSYPEISLMRAVYFIFISTGAVVAGYLWQSSNNTSLSFLLASNIIVILLSVFSLLTNIPSDSWTGGNEKGFMGFAGHQNTLASAILFTVPSVFERIINKKLQFNYKLILLYLLLILNLLFLVLTYSRASMLVLAAASFLYLIFSSKWKLLAYSSAAIILIFSIAWLSPTLNNEIKNLLRKGDPEFYSTRQWLWEPSYIAALGGGLTGLGYGISHPEIEVPGTGSHYENGRYIREKGNSFLALIEETGIIGLLLFILPLGYILKTYNYDNKRSLPAILPAMFIALILHSQFEAWMVGVGSIHLPLFFFYGGSMLKVQKEF